MLTLARWRVDLGSLLPLSFFPFPFSIVFVAFLAFMVVSFRSKMGLIRENHFYASSLIF